MRWRCHIHTECEPLIAAETKLAQLESDREAAAKDLPVPMPEPGTDMARLLSANVLLRRRVAELEAKHPEWMKRIQRERLEERERCIQFFFGMVHSHPDSPRLRQAIREALA